MDDVMRGVEVPAGRHTIVWSYDVPGLALGGLLSLFALLAILLAAVYLVMSRRQRLRSARLADTPTSAVSDENAP